MSRAAKRELSDTSAFRRDSSFECPRPNPIRGQFDLKESAEQVRGRICERTQEWLASSLKSQDQLSTPNLDLAEELYQSLINALRRLHGPDAHQLFGETTVALKDVFERLFLWGREYRHGRLSLVLCNARELRGTVLDCLRQIGNSLLRSTEQHSEFEGLDNFRRLRSLIEESYYDSELSPTDIEDNVGPQNVLPRTLDSPFIEDHFQQSPDDCYSDDGKSICSTSTGGNDICSIIEGEVDCLMELLPSMEQSYAYLQLSWENPRKSKDQAFSVSAPALPFVQRVADRFGNADTDLVQRLGESDWQRFMTIRARMDQISKLRQHLQVTKDSVPEPLVSVIFEDDSKPKSMFRTETLFQDSGLGTSVPSASSVARSDVSHTSFLSSGSGDAESSLRVPKTPAAVSLGEVFTCEICGRKLHGIRNRIDWKRHVFEDLQPYICTFPSCDKHLVKFASRSQWSDHEFNEHRVLRSWNCPECDHNSSSAAVLEQHLRKSHPSVLDDEQVPLIAASALSVQAAPIQDQECSLCRTFPGKSRRHFVKHLARHLESLALLALPQDSEEQSDQESIVSEDHQPNRAHEISQEQPYAVSKAPIEETDSSTKGKKIGEGSHQAVTPDSVPSVGSLRSRCSLEIDPSIPRLYRGFQKAIHEDKDSQTSGKWVCTLGCTAWSHQSKGSWRRHEHNHYPQKVWICTEVTCIYKSPRARTFVREDLFKRHRLIKHGNKLTSQDSKNCQLIVLDSLFPKHCVFYNCTGNFATFNERMSHIEAHLELKDQLDRSRIVIFEGPVPLSALQSQSNDAGDLNFQDHDLEKETYLDSVALLTNDRGPSSRGSAETVHGVDYGDPTLTKCKCGRTFGMTRNSQPKSARSSLRRHIDEYSVVERFRCHFAGCNYASARLENIVSHEEKRQHVLSEGTLHSWQPQLLTTYRPPISRNKYGQRIDHLRKIDPTDFRHVQKIKMCNAHYLRRDCPFGEHCIYTHSYKPSKKEVEILEQVSRATPCRFGTECDEIQCTYGHRCPHETEGQKGCPYGWNCKFPPHMHGIDTGALEMVEFEHPSLLGERETRVLTYQAEKLEKCPIPSCGYNAMGFARKYDRDIHALTHYKGTMVCGFCAISEATKEMSFKRLDVFKSHLISVHGAEQLLHDDKTILSTTKSSSLEIGGNSGKCTNCSSTFSNAQKLFNHLDECILKCVEQGEPSGKINEQHLDEINKDPEVKETLRRHKSPSELKQEDHQSAEET